MLKIRNLQANHLTTPIGIDVCAIAADMDFGGEAVRPPMLSLF